MLSRLMGLSWTRLSHSESGKAGHLGVLTMLALTCFRLTDPTWRRSSVARSLGRSSSPNNLFRITQGRSDSSAFFFFLATVRELEEEDLNLGPLFDQDELLL